MQTTTFAELGLSAKVLAAIEASGYSTPTPIQAQAIPVAMTGRDVLGIAQTGTGKTASFVLPMICRLETGRARARMPRSLILAPTRELAAQCAQSFEKYGQNHKLSVALLIGGVSMDEQVRKLDRGVDVLIATPGRLLDHFQRGRIMLMGVEILVIDEADRMLDMGFIPDIERICKLLPPKRQTLFFSATMPPEITRLVDQFLTDPQRIEVARPATTATTIKQRFRFAPSSEDWAKREILRELIRDLDVRNAIIFCNRKKDVAILLKSLEKHGFNAGALHGDMDQLSRMATLDKFRNGEIALLAASDVAARGLDIPDVSHVINFDVPWQADDYVHRIGRTGRAGKEGCSVTIVSVDDLKSIDSIAKLTGVVPEWIGDAPSEQDIADSRTRKRRGRGRPGVGDSRGGEGRGRFGEGRGREARGRRSGGRGDGRERGESVPRGESGREDVREPHVADAGTERTSRAPPVAHAEPRRERVRPAADQPQPYPDDAPAPRQAREPRRERSGERRQERPRDVQDERHEEQPRERRDERRAGRHDERRGDRRPERRPDNGRDAPPAARETRASPLREAALEQARRHTEQRKATGSRTPLGLGDHIPAFLKRPVRSVAD